MVERVWVPPRRIPQVSLRCAGNRSSLIRHKRSWFSMAGFAVLVLCCRAVYGQTSPAETPAAAPANPVPPEMAAFQRARLEVDKFFEQATNVVCTENVSQAVVGKNGKVSYREDSVFDYQLQANPNSGSMKLVESRDTRKAAFRDSSRTLLITKDRKHTSELQSQSNLVCRLLLEKKTQRLPLLAAHAVRCTLPA